MKNLKKLLAIILAVVMCASTLGLTVFAEDDTPDGVERPAPDGDGGVTLECTCTVKGECEGCPVCAGNSDDCKGEEAHEDTYTVKVTIAEAFTDVTVSLTGPVNQEIHVDSVGAFGSISFEKVPAGQYTVVMTGVGGDGLNYKGTCDVYPFYFNNASNGVVSGPSIWNFTKDVKGMVTFTGSIINSYPAKDGNHYSFENQDLRLKGMDGTWYSLTRDENYNLSVMVPANQPYYLYAYCWEYQRLDNRGNCDESIMYETHFGDKQWLTFSLKAENFAQDCYFQWWALPDYIYVKDMGVKTFDAKVTVKDGGTYAGIPGSTVKITDPNGDVHEGTTDENGVATIAVPEFSGDSVKYTVEATTPDGRTRTKESDTFVLNGGDLVVMDGLKSFSAVVNCYAGDQLLSSKTQTNLYGGAYITGIQTYGIAQLVKTEAFNAEDNPIELEPFDTTSWHTKLAKGVDIAAGSTITVNFYYEYTDADMEYKVNVTHIFKDAKGSVVHQENDEIVVTPGERTDILRQVDEHSNAVKKDIAGYTAGAWIMGLSETAGASGNAIVGGSENLSGNQLDIAFVMPHQDVDITFYYSYADRYVEYLANAEDATGAMFVKWCKANEGVYVDGIDGENNSYKRVGYNFVEWNLAADGTDKAYKPGDVLKVDNNVTLYAQWTPIKYTVTFDAAGGSDVDPQIVKHGETATSAVTSREGYTFNGWYLDDEQYDFATPVTADITLTAQWTANYVPPTTYRLTINYVYEDGGQAAPSYSGWYNYGEQYSIASPSIEGYEPDMDVVEGRITGTASITVTYSPVEEDIPEEDTPLEDKPIEDEPVEDEPVEELPEEEDIPEDDVPLIDAPETGDDLLVWILLAATSALGIAVLTGKKKFSTK